jgi:ABC-type transport system substrate-binding protein
LGAPTATAAPPATSQAAGAQAPTGEWVVAITEDPDTLDLQKTAAAAIGAIYRYLGDSLISKDFDRKMVPGLVKTWKASADGLNLRSSRTASSDTMVRRWTLPR